MNKVNLTEQQKERLRLEVLRSCGVLGSDGWQDRIEAAAREFCRVNEIETTNLVLRLYTSLPEPFEFFL